MNTENCIFVQIKKLFKPDFLNQNEQYTIALFFCKGISFLLRQFKQFLV